MGRSGVVLACIGLLVGFTCANVASFEDTIRMHQMPQLAGYEGSALSNGVGRLTSLRRLHQSGFDLSKALIGAAWNGDTSLVQRLLDAGADPNYINSDGKYSALTVAASHNHVDVIRLLLERGALVGLTVNDGFSAVVVAAIFGHADAVRALLDGGANVNEAMIQAAIGNDTTVILILIQRGGNANHENSKGLTVLGTAAYFGNQESIEVLLENGADKTKTDGAGYLPRDLLCQCIYSSEIHDWCKVDECQSPGRMISLLNP